MIGLWLGNVSAQRSAPTDATTRRDWSSEVRGLQQEVERLKLLNQALWELIRDRTDLTDAALTEKAQEVDLRDGMEDGRMSHTRLKCPKCGRVSSSRHWRCLYCGLEFEKPVMG